MNVDAILSLPEKVAKLPEVGETIRSKAKALAQRALKIKSDYGKLLEDRDDFIGEIQDLWNRDERKESGL